jgi:hypothetical protein
MSRIIAILSAALFSTLCHAVQIEGSKPIIVPPNSIQSLPKTDLDNVSPSLLQGACMQAVLQELKDEPVEILFDRIVPKVQAAADLITCQVTGKLYHINDKKRRYPDVIHAPVDAEYAVSIDAKTMKATVNRTDTAKAKDLALMAVAAKYIDITARSVEPGKAVFDATLADGKKCVVTMTQDRGMTPSPWQISGLQCGAKKPAHANAEKTLQKMAVVLAEGQCAAVLKKTSGVMMSGSAAATYTADNGALHQCQYVQEMAASQCVESKTCPTYEAWAAQNPDFTPSMPRVAFISKLEGRQRMLSALRSDRDGEK